MIAALFLAASFAAAPASAGIEASKPGAAAEIELSWRYKKLDGRMEVYELKEGSDWPYWKMGTAAGLAELPLGRRVEGPVSVAPGQDKLLVLVFRSGKGRGARFFAAPHTMSPAERSFGCEFWCLCLNDVYEAPAGKVWYRVVKLGVKEGAVGGRIKIAHTLVGVGDSKR